MVTTYKTKKEKLTGLKAQLKFRQCVLRQPPVDGLSYVVTKLYGNVRKVKPPEDLAESPKQLITNVCDVLTVEGNVLVGKRVRQRFLHDDFPQGVWWYGRVVSRVFHSDKESISFM